MKNIKVLMCGSKLSVGGGMVTVIENYLNCEDWGNIKITYVPTHVDSKTIIKYIYYIYAYIKIWILTSFSKFDIAHLHTTENGSFYRKAYLMHMLQKKHIKVIMHHHIDYEEFYSTQKDRQKEFIRKTFSKADLNITLGKNLSDFILEKQPNAKVRILYNAVKGYDHNRYNPNAKHVMFLGWLIERKGISDFLNLIKEVDPIVDKEFKVYLCGDGDTRVKDRIRELGIQHRIDHIGWVPKDQLETYFSETFVNILPSYREGLPMTILETMSYGIPNISTNIATIPEVIESGRNGFLIEPGDIKQLSKITMDLYNNRQKRKDLSEAAFLSINERFVITVHIEQLSKIYNGMII